MSTITTAAREALKAAQQERQDRARGVVLRLLGPKVLPTALSVADMTDDVVVFTDGTVHLAVREDGVHLVTGKPGEWTSVAGPLADLADLGRALA